MTALDVSYTHTIAAPPDRVFRALTDPADLTVWFAEGVAIDARPGGGFSFWGRHTYGTPAHPGIQTRLHTFEPDREIAFDWPLEGQAGRVTLSLAPKDDGTAVTARHVLADSPAIGRARELVDDLWRMHLGALGTHLSGQPVTLPDFADPHPQVRLSIHVDAPRAAVWRTLTDPALLDQWLTKAAVIDLAAGTLDFGWRYEENGREVVVPPMQLLEIAEPERLVMEWRDWRGDPDVPHQRVTWLLSEDGDGTRVDLVHDGFTRTADISDYPWGWRWFLQQIRTVGEAAAANG
ncbi:SRPBCC family protein [Maricaulis virginensis]|uniref:Activator of Hsp90 ATPase homologue 1/2-like C-terminal domain-containing protein n=1 Tax=Maricaulis virginensis TaxID=144022 RepID=A0A9W6MPI9_9PROT|nr:SRPBCC family protein [Maricaulis virginensis]GLK53006.1 hypothetical protein GCM10017621_25140 [Maricaulis virginensis]